MNGGELPPSAEASGLGRRSTVPAGQPLPRLTSLRALGAIAVLVFHLDKWGIASLPAHLSRLGYIGVAFFFVLSGFVLVWGTRPELPALAFYRRRFARIWPNHFAMLLVAAVVPVVAGSRGWVVAVPNALLVQAWFPDGRVVYSMDGVAWSLSCEALFYASFPAVVLMLIRMPPRYRWLMCAVGLLLELLASIFAPAAAFHFPPARFPEFLLGMVAGLCFRDGWRPRIAGWTVAGSLLLGGAISAALPAPIGDVVLVGPFLSALLFAASRDVAVHSGWLRHPILVFAGEASFAFYLVHELAVLNFRHFVAVDAALEVTGIVLLSVACAVLLHLAVERPCNRLLRGGSRSKALSAHIT